MSKIKEMTEFEYVETKGVLCPACRSEDMELYDTQWDNAVVFGYVQCLSCKVSWTEFYDLTGYWLDETEKD